MSLLKIPGFECWEIISPFLRKALFLCNTMYVWAVLQAWFLKLRILPFPTRCPEKAMAPHSSTLAWKIPWTEETGGLQSMGSRLSNFTFTFHFHALVKEMATYSSVLAWGIPGMAEPGGLLSTGSHRVRHNWNNLAAAAANSLASDWLCLNTGPSLSRCVSLSRTHSLWTSISLSVRWRLEWS